jgi:hypothetical protein
MLRAKLAAVIQTKVAVALVGAAVVATGGTAAAMVATHGDLSQIGSAASQTAGNDHGAAHQASPAAGHSGQCAVSAEGTLVTVSLSGGSGSITVKEADGTSTTFHVDKNTRVNGAHATTLADLARAQGAGDKVQVQANKPSGCSGTALAWKVTVEGAGSHGQPGGGNGGGNGDGDGGQSGHGNGHGNGHG